ncbi:MAG: hypothetical protein ACK4PN_08580 [Allorhizobium sp.]
MMALLDWIDAVPPISISQFLVIFLPFMLGQTFVFAIALLSDPLRRRAPPARAEGGGPDGP